MPPEDTLVSWGAYGKRGQKVKPTGALSAEESALRGQGYSHDGHSPHDRLRLIPRLVPPTDGRTRGFGPSVRVNDERGHGGQAGSQSGLVTARAVSSRPSHFTRTVSSSRSHSGNPPGGIMPPKVIALRSRILLVCCAHTQHLLQNGPIRCSGFAQFNPIRITNTRGLSTSSLSPHSTRTR